MSKKNRGVLSVFVLILIALPFVIDIMYSVGELYPIIITPYNRTDILLYLSTSLGLIIALIAVFISIDSNKPKIEITREQYVKYDENKQMLGTDQCQISIRNQSPFDISIKNIGLISSNKHKLNKQRLKYIFSASMTNIPITIFSFSNSSLEFQNERLEDNLLNWGTELRKNNLKEKVIYYVELSDRTTIEKRYKYDDIYLNKEEQTKWIK